MSKFRAGNNGASKLTANEVRKIRELYATTDVTQGQLSRDFDVSIVQIGRIVRGEVWQHLPATMPTREDLAMSAKRMMEVQEEVNAMPALERMARAVEAEIARSPDAMLDELAKGEERDATETDRRHFTLTGIWPPGVRAPKESTE